MEILPSSFGRGVVSFRIMLTCSSLPVTRRRKIYGWVAGLKTGHYIAFWGIRGAADFLRLGRVGHSRAVLCLQWILATGDSFRGIWWRGRHGLLWRRHVGWRRLRRLGGACLRRRFRWLGRLGRGGVGGIWLACRGGLWGRRRRGGSSGGRRSGR